MTTVDKDNFEKKLHDWLKDFISCHGNDRLLSKEELNCVKVEFAPVSNHGNSLFTVYVCPTWEVYNMSYDVCVCVCVCVCVYYRYVVNHYIYYMWSHSHTGERTGGIEYWIRDGSGCGQLILYDRIQLMAEKLSLSWQQQQEAM